MSVRNNSFLKTFDFTTKEPAMPQIEQVETEMRRRALAVEAAMLMLVDGLAARGTISADEAEDMLRVLAKGSDFSNQRASSSMRMVDQLRRLRRGDGAATPGA
jgi:hypothetical protein